MKDKPEKSLPKGLSDTLEGIPTVDEVVDTDDDLMAEDDLNIPILTDIAAEILEEEAAATSGTESGPGENAAATIAGSALATSGTVRNDIAGAKYDPVGNNPKAADSQQALVQALIEHGTSRAQMARIIDDLVAEHLPRLEQQLRIRLHNYLSSLKAAGDDREQ